MEDFTPLVNNVKQTAWQCVKLMQKMDDSKRTSSLTMLCQRLGFNTTSEFFSKIRESPESARQLKHQIMQIRAELKGISP